VGSLDPPCIASQRLWKAIYWNAVIITTKPTKQDVVSSAWPLKLNQIFSGIFISCAKNKGHTEMLRKYDSLHWLNEEAKAVWKASIQWKSSNEWPNGQWMHHWFAEWSANTLIENCSHGNINYDSRIDLNQSWTKFSKSGNLYVLTRCRISERLYNTRMCSLATWDGIQIRKVAWYFIVCEIKLYLFTRKGKYGQIAKRLICKIFIKLPKQNQEITEANNLTEFGTTVC
jgi:hypothetical protein